VKYRKDTYMSIEAWGNIMTWQPMGTEVSFDDDGDDDDGDDDDMVSLQLSVSC